MFFTPYFHIRFVESFFLFANVLHEFTWKTRLKKQHTHTHTGKINMKLIFAGTAYFSGNSGKSYEIKVQQTNENMFVIFIKKYV